MNTITLYSLFKGSRIPKKIIIRAIYEYIGSKNGLRTVAWKNGLTHQALWYWVRKFRLFRERLHKIIVERGGIPEVIVVDETKIKTSQGIIYLWFVLDPHNKTLLGFSITKGRSVLECLLTFRYWFRCSVGSPNLVSSSLMLVPGILSYLVSDLIILLLVVEYGHTLSVLMPVLRPIVGFTLFSTVPALFELFMAPIISQVFLLSLCFIITSFAPPEPWTPTP